MGLRPRNCEACGVDGEKLHGSRLRYCRKCRRYLCVGSHGCFGFDYCIICEKETT